MSKKENFIHLLSITKGLFDKQKEVEDTFGIEESQYLSYEVSDLVDIALNVIDIPRDTSLQYNHDHPNYYNRDKEYNIVYGYIYGSINSSISVYEQLKGE